MNFDLSSPGVLAAGVTIVLALILYFLFAPRNTGTVTRKTDVQSKLINDLYQSLPAGVGKSEHSWLNNFLATANVKDKTAQELFYQVILNGIAGLLIGIVAGLALATATPIPVWGWTIAFFLLAISLPFLKLQTGRAVRAESYRRDLPEALDLLVISLQSGQTFPSALRECVPFMRDSEVKRDFQKMLIAVQSGKTLNEALDEFSQTSPSDAIRTFAVSLKEANELNVPLVEPLRNRSDASRAEFFSWLQEFAAQLETKITMVLLGTMIPALVVLLAAPSVASFASNF